MENVRIGILTAYDEVCAFADNNVDNALHYYNDELVEYLKGSASTYTFSANAKHPDSEFLVEGNKIAFRRKEKDYYMNVMHVERNENEVTVEAYSLSFELLNEQRSAYKASSAMSFEQYLAVFDPEHVVTLGINEVSGRNITHEWEGDDTILARLFSLATVFSAELEFLPELNDDYSLKRIVMNVYNEHSDTNQGVGQNRDDIILRYGRDISGITKTSDITELYTAITPTGTDGLTVASLDKTEYDADGNVEYISPLHNPHIYAVQARDRFPSNLMANENERYIGVNWEYDTSNVNTLYGQALAQLKKNCVPKISYTVEDYFDTGIGDTVTIADESFLPILYLSARVTEQHISFTDPSQNKTTFDNFKELQSQIDESLLSRVQELIAQNRTYTAMISTDNGIVFRNGIGSTAMTAHIRDAGGIELSENYEIHWYKDGEEVYIGNPYTISADDVDGKAVYRFDAVDTSGKVTAFYEVTVSDVNDGQDGEDGEPGPEGPVGPIGPPGADGKSLYTWIKYADSPTTGMSDTPEGKRYMGIAYNQEIPVESTDYDDYEWSLITGEGVPGPAGEDGKTYYTWIRYADDANGNGISDNPSGKDYIGIAYNQEIPTESNNPNDYVWSLFRGPQGIQGPQGEQGVPGPAGEDGKTTYFHIKYSPNANGNPMSETPDVYIGTYVDFNQVDSADPEDYTWMRFQGVQGADGVQGIPGTNGEDGKTSYLHIAYANSADGKNGFSVSDSEGKQYIGQYVDFVQTDSTDPEAYSWTKIKGEDGKDGASLYTWIKYADTPTTGMSDSPDGKQYMGIAYNKTTPTESNDYSDYAWSLITGEGVPGAPGEDGKTLYTWVRYADNAQGGGISDAPEGKDYIGLAYNKETPVESNDPSDYTWSLFRGPQGIQGPQGTPGPAGTDGRTSYFHVKYSSVASPTSSSQMTETPSEYIGTYVDFAEMDSNDPSDYTWSRFRGMDGSQGIPGTNGEDGKTSYLHIAYANSADGHTSFSISDSTGRAYMGQYVDFIQADSSNPDDYTWSKIKGEDGKVLYTWIKYADTPTSGMSDSPDGKKYMGIAYNKESETESTKYSDYAWSLILGEGIPGEAGEDGKTLYTWVKYADDANGGGMSNDPTGKNYIGLAYNKETPTESNSPSDYAWSLFRGPQGIPGEDGKSSYIYIRYSAVSNPTSSSQISTTPNKYIGIQVSQNPVASTSPADYTWAQFTGDPGATGARGPAGPDGKTPYIHFAYANSADGRTDFSTTTSAGRSYMGQYADYTETDSTDPSDYTWVKVKGEDGSDGNPTGITVSATEPRDPYTGMLWKHTGTVPGLVQNATYRWNGSSWELYLFVAENLEVDSLSALSANLGHVTAGSIVIPWSISDNPQFNVDGTTEFSNAEGGGNPLVMNYTQKNKQDGNVEANGYTRYGYDGVTIQVTLPNGITREVQLTYTSLMMRDDDGYAVMEKSDLEKFFTGVYPGGNFTGNINTLLDPGTYYCNFSNIQNAAFSTGYGWCLNLKSSDTSRLQQLFRYSSEGIDGVAIRYYINSQWYPWRWIPVNNGGRWTAIPLTSGYVTSERRAPQYRVSAGRVEFRGQVERSDGAVLNGTLGTLPSDVRPATSKIFQQADDSHGGCRVAITTDGQIQSRTINDSKYVSLDGIFYYL